MKHIISEIYEIFQRSGKISIDSRKIEPGAIYIALRGESHNGNDYATEALAKGAICAIVDEPTLPKNNQFIHVPDTLLFLQKLANHHRRALNIPILGITGTNGKTTTKELCRAVLSQKYKTTATAGNYNNHIGVPLTLLNMDNSTELGIVEMGANHPGEIEQLCRIAEPNYGVITNIGYAHLEGFGSFEKIVETKSELYRYIETKNGILFVNSDDPLLLQLTEGYSQKYIYGANGVDVKGEVVQPIPNLVFDLNTPSGHLYIRTKLIGEYNFDNAMAACAVGSYFKIDPLKIKDALETYTPSNMRSQWIETDNNTIILDAYNANPSSMERALAGFAAMKSENKVLIVGEMLELGDASKEAHIKLLKEIERINAKKVFLVGRSFDSIANNFNFTATFWETDSLIEYLRREQINSSLVFIKGSRGNKLERVVEYL